VKIVAEPIACRQRWRRDHNVFRVKHAGVVLVELGDKLFQIRHVQAAVGHVDGISGQQTAAAMTIMKESLEKADCSMTNVLKVQVSLVGPEKNWEGINEAYNGFFPEPRPVRSYFGTTRFRRAGQLLQID